METFVSGANGFVGSRLVYSLREAGHRVHAAYRQRPKQAHINDIVIGDICEQIDWATHLDNIDIVIHCATRVHQMQDTTKNEHLYPEDTPQPNGAYAESKYQAEKALLNLTEKGSMELVIYSPHLGLWKRRERQFCKFGATSQYPFTITFRKY